MSTLPAIDCASPQAVELFTRSGVALSIRPAEPQDKLLLEDFFRHVSADDLRFRFLTSIRRVDDARIDQLCAADVTRTVTFVALRRNLLIAIGALAGDPGTGEAEVALTTRPDWKHQGVSWSLLEHLVGFARAQGYKEIMSIEAPDNAGALGLERDMGFKFSLLGADGGEFVARKVIASD